MPRGKKGTRKPAPKSGAALKYDAHATALEDAYGMLADLRRELSDSREDVDEREDILELFAKCKDEQRAWLLLEDYFSKLKLSRKDFPGDDWWDDVAKAKGKKRLEALSVVFLRAGRQMPAELNQHANLKRFKEIEKAERERAVFKELEHWMFPPAPNHLDAPRASIRAVAVPEPEDLDSSLQTLRVEFVVRRPRTGDRKKSITNLVDLTVRAAHEKELFPAEDWEFIEWVVEHYGDELKGRDSLTFTGQPLLQWLAHWGGQSRLQPGVDSQPYEFHGQLAELSPSFKNGTAELAFTHTLLLPDGREVALEAAKFFAGRVKDLKGDFLEPIMEAFGDDPPEEIEAIYEAVDSIKIRTFNFKGGDDAKKALPSIEKNVKAFSQKYTGAKLMKIDDFMKEALGKPRGKVFQPAGS